MSNIGTAAEVEEIELHPEPEHNLRNVQSDVTVANVILRGNKLRESKPLYYERNDRYPVIIDVPKPHTIRKRKNRNVLSKPCPGCSQWTIIPCSQSVVSVDTVKSKKIKLRKKVEKKTRCPMRIAELAVPSKRHCIDTWRYKSYLLPEIMVERLKHQVLDQRPVVQISDAVHYFRKRKTRSSKDSRCRPAKDVMSGWKKQLEIPLRYQKSRALCIIFAHKILQRLSIPLKLTINSDLEKISQVIASDIVLIMKGKKYANTPYTQHYRKVHADVINKITVWIAGILEDLAYKELEEDLRDLEEEEGPVLDFLDDLLDKVLDICVPKPIEMYSEVESKKSSSFGSLDEHIDDALTDSEYFENLISELIDTPETDDIQAGIQADILDILNNFLKDDDDTVTDTEYFKKVIGDLIGISTKESDDETFNDEVTDAEYLRDIINDLLNVIFKESEENVEINSDGLINEREENTERDILAENIEDDYPETTENGENDFKTYAETLSDGTDDGGKKVMFSDSNIVTSGDVIDPSQSSNILVTPKQSTIINNKLLKDNLDIAEPNENLLSDADELWPAENFSPHILKPVQSVTKSMTSLGKITEDQEKDLSLSLLDVTIDEQENVFYDDEEKQLDKHPENLENNVSLTPLDPTIDEQKNVLITDEEILSNKLPEDQEKNLSVLDPTMDEQKNVLMDDEEKQTVKSPTTNEEITDVEEKFTNKSPVKSDVSLKTSIEDVTSLILSMQKLIQAEVEKIATYEPTPVDESAQVSIGIISKGLCNTETQTNERDEIKPPKAILQKSKTIVTSIDPKPVANKFGKDNVIKGVPEKQKHKNKKIIATRNPNKTTRDSNLTKRFDLSQREIHDWCRDLEKGFQNLDIWQNWIQYTCKATTDLLIKKNEFKCYNESYMHLWKKIKSNIDEDAILWQNMSQSTHERFVYFQKYYHKTNMGNSNYSSRYVCVCEIDAKKTV